MDYVATYEFDVRCKRSREIRKLKNRFVSMNWNAPVLVDNAHFIKPPEKIALGGCNIPSVIRLKRFDDAHCVCGYSVSISSKSAPALAVVNVKNRKISVLGIGERQSGQGPDQLIKCRPDAVQKVTQNERDYRRSAPDFDVKQIASILQITFGPDGVGFRFPEFPKFIPEVIKVFLRPGGLQFGISH